MTDFRARGTIMGPAGLTAVFGMGTGVTPPVWSPESRPAGGQAGRSRGSTLRRSGQRRPWSIRAGGKSGAKAGVALCGRGQSPGRHHRRDAAPGGTGVSFTAFGRHGKRLTPGHRRLVVRRGCGRRVGVVKPLGCWDRSAAAVARRALPAHRPGRLPGAFAANAAGNLVLEGASRLDAFSAYPVPTWLPGGAPSGTAGTPEVGPPQSSRTRGDAPQVSYAHGR